MACKVICPKQGLQMTSGTITKWLIPEGGKVEKDKPLFEMETDKLTITIDAQADGTLLKILHAEGDEVPVTETIAVIGTPGEDISEFLAPAASEAAPAAATAAVPGAEVARTVQKESPVNADSHVSGRVFVTPRARTTARQRGIDPELLAGSGPDGMVIERDVLSVPAVSATPLARVIASQQNADLTKITGSGMNGKICKRDITAAAGMPCIGEDTIIPLTGMRRAIADNMMTSLHSMAQANHRIHVNMSECVKMRAAYKDTGRKISYNDILILLLSRALLEYPALNALCDGEKIYRRHTVNMGIAVAVENGLIVPTLRSSENLTLEEIHRAAAELAEKARTGGLTRDDYSDGSFTVTNLGMYDIDEFTAVINPPQVAILAVGKIADAPVVENGQVVIRPMCALTLTYDHRAVDGAPAAQFLQRVKQLIENPYYLF